MYVFMDPLNLEMVVIVLLKILANNLIMVDSTVASEMQFLCPFDVPTQEIFAYNIIVSYVQDAPFYECIGYNTVNTTLHPFISTYNQFFTPNQSSLPFTTQGCNSVNDTTLQSWQSIPYGFDIGSTINEFISIQQILYIAKFYLGM